MFLPRWSAAILCCATSLGAQGSEPRPMNFLDMRLMRSAGSLAISPKGEWMLYTLTVPDWKEAKSFSDVYVVSTRGGASGRQLTFTRHKNESSPSWAPDGQFFAFSSDRDAPANGAATQLYIMRPDGGEALKLTDVKDGVGTFAFSRDGRWLAYSAEKPEDRQVMALPLAGIDTATPRPLTRHTTPVAWWRFSKDGRRLFFTAPDSIDQLDRQRLEKKFDVRIRNQDLPLNHLWMVDLATGTERRLTQGEAFSVEAVTLSDDGRWAGFRGYPNDRYVRTTMEGGNHSDLYLLEIESGRLERLTTNTGISESALSFSPDGATIAFTASDDFVYFRANRVYVRAVAATGAAWRKLGASHDGDVSVGFWAADGRTIYFNTGIKATMQVMALDVASNTVQRVTDFQAVTAASRDEESGKILLQYSDPRQPPVHFVVDEPTAIGNRDAWRQVTDANPQAKEFALGHAEEISWKSRDGKTVGGILVKPVGWQAGRRYPLIVAIHGGPQSADLLTFNGGYGAQIYAGDGYAVLLPNYRGSTNYGEAHKWGIVNDYFKKGYEDIMTGVDHLIAQGIVDPERMGALGWSAGGHWSNWILVNTNRFKAISSGAGTVNWISMYAQSDMQDVRMHYLGNRLPYDDFEPYWKQSPIRYIRNAKTPTMIHVVDGDPRVPRPQSEELYMALRKLGVPTELFVYPGATHGIPDPRNQLLKSVAEKAWMDKWIRGTGGFRWEEVLKTLEESPRATSATTSY